MEAAAQRTHPEKLTTSTFPIQRKIEIDILSSISEELVSIIFTLAKTNKTFKKSSFINVWMNVSQCLYFCLLQANIFSNTMLLGLQYEPETEKLTLKIIQASLAAFSLNRNQGEQF